NTIAMANGAFDDVPFEFEISDTISAYIGNDYFISSEVSKSTTDDNRVELIATDGSNNQLELSFPSNVSEGSYSITEDGNYTALYTTDAGGENADPYVPVNETGTIVFTEIYPNFMLGSFSLSVRNDAGEVLQITQGFMLITTEGL